MKQPTNPPPTDHAQLADRFFRRGESYRRQGDFERAVACYAEAIRRSPTCVAALLERGQIYRLARKPERAISDFNAILEIDARHTEAYYQRGLALRAAGAPKAALEDFSRALVLKPEHAEAAAARAETQQESPRPPYRPTPAPARGRSRPATALPDSAERRQRIRWLAGVSVAVIAVLLVFVVANSANQPAGEFEPPKTVSVQGTVLYKGKPLDGVRVMLHPQFDIGRIKFRPSGTTDARGHFTLSTGSPNDGAPPGEYVVTFSRPKGADDDEVDTWRGRHNDPSRSKWRVVVRADGPLDPLRID